MEELRKQKLSLDDLDLRNKRLFLRVDFNVPLNADGQITDDTRIHATLTTIRYAQGHGAKVILASHLGRPGGKPDPRYSLQPVAKRLGTLLGSPVMMAEDCIGPAVQQRIAEMPAGAVLLLENLRFHEGERANDREFAQALADLADLYVNDAFGAAHRAHASIVGVPALLPQAAAGFLLQQEVACLGKVLYQPEKPFTLILGGAKVSDKMGVIKHLLPQLDALLIGGGMAYTFLRAQGIRVGESLVEEEHREQAAQLLVDASHHEVQLLLPQDHVIAEQIEPNAEHRIIDQQEIPAGWKGVDIGPKTREAFATEIHRSQMLFWNGPMGVFEVKPFHEGTVAIGQAVADAGAISMVGGGDTVAALQQAGIAERIDCISTGGGAALEFLEGKELPGIAALTDK